MDITSIQKKKKKKLLPSGGLNKMIKMIKRHCVIAMKNVLLQTIGVVIFYICGCVAEREQRDYSVEN